MLVPSDGVLRISSKSKGGTMNHRSPFLYCTLPAIPYRSARCFASRPLPSAVGPGSCGLVKSSTGSPTVALILGPESGVDVLRLARVVPERIDPDEEAEGGETGRVAD